MYIEKINGPQDVKKLSIDELNALASEMRDALLHRASVHGGHFGPNFGIVEATIALHYVFDSPHDKFVFDVSHQSYPHKILTGRKEAYIAQEHYDDVTGYTSPIESEHDMFTVGHTSTSVSLACGLARGRDVTNGKGNVIALIGDGSISGGEALEGFNVAGEMDSNLIIIANDNQMSIAENHGGLYKNLKLLRDTDGKAECNLFKSMGLDYVYVKNGNNIEELIKAFKSVKDIDHPVVVHINTLKGKGYKPAETDKESWHWCMPFDIETGNTTVNFPDEEDYSSITTDYLRNKMKSDKSVVAITAGTPALYGFTPDERKAFGRQFLDVGIAEQTAVAMASAIAKNGGKPVFNVYSSFIQRTYDQLSQDLCIDSNPATILVFIVYFVHPLIHQVLSLIPHTAGIALIAILGIALLSDIIVTTSAIVKFNQYLERLKHITDELHAISNQIGSELYQNVMHVLDMQESSRQKLDDVKLEVSEEIRMQIVELKTRAQNLGEKVPKPARRLLKAFPKLESRNYKAQLELFRQKLEQHLGRH